MSVRASLLCSSAGKLVFSNLRRSNQLSSQRFLVTINWQKRLNRFIFEGNLQPQCLSSTRFQSSSNLPGNCLSIWEHSEYSGMKEITYKQLKSSGIRSL